MAPNPNPELITDEMWRLWEMRPNKAWTLSGIYANKKGYHNTVNANVKFWPTSYSIRLPLDLKGPRDKARAIDLTMSDSEMIKVTSRMRASALDPNDHRLAAVKEFYGTLDGKEVFGLTKDSEDGLWRHSSADDTHLWHLHTSIFTSFVNQWTHLAPIISVWAGQSLSTWEGSVFGVGLPQYGDVGEDVVFWQYMHNRVRNTFDPPLPTLTPDGNYGNATAAAIAAFWTAINSKGNFDGKRMLGWLAMNYHSRLASTVVPPTVNIPSPTPVLDHAAMEQYINNYVKDYLANSHLRVEGTIEGSLIAL